MPLPRTLRVHASTMALLTLTNVAWSQTFPSGRLIYTDHFSSLSTAWRVEMEQPGTVTAKDGVLDIDVPAGATVWLRQKLDGPVMIQYEATVVSAGGPNDRVSDLNSFWMATDPNSPKDLFSHARSGKFAEYNSLNLYYVGLGGNGNTTTRFRRYIGDETARPLLPENDIAVAQHPDKGILANKPQRITLIANGTLIQYWRDQEKIFELIDPHPYTSGWFGIRTTKNHMQIRNLRISQLTGR